MKALSPVAPAYVSVGAADFERLRDTALAIGGTEIPQGANFVNFAAPTVFEETGLPGVPTLAHDLNVLWGERGRQQYLQLTHRERTSSKRWMMNRFLLGAEGQDVRLFHGWAFRCPRPDDLPEGLARTAPDEARVQAFSGGLVVEDVLLGQGAPSTGVPHIERDLHIFTTARIQLPNVL
jgi:hypothetical protein